MTHVARFKCHEIYMPHILHVACVCRLDLRVPLDRAVASELYELALRQEGENWMGETIDGRSFSAPEDYENPWVIPERGVLELRWVKRFHH